MILLKQTLIQRAASSKRESKHIEFKESFDINSAQDWCEIIKDIIAIANSGGGILVFGSKSDGTPVNYDCNEILKLDPVTITDKISKYTNTCFHEFELEEIAKDNFKLAGLIINEARIPIVFCRPGTYQVKDGKPKSAFSQGTIYFRHGAKSEPCNSDDLEEIIKRNLEHIRKSWLGNIRKVITAPTGSKVEVLPSAIFATTNNSAVPIRITNDESAPKYKLVDPNSTHPFRGKEIINELNKRFKLKLNSFHLRCIRQQFNIDSTRPDLFYKPRYSSPLFSQLFLDWLSDSYQKDKDFFERTREAYIKKT